MGKKIRNLMLLITFILSLIKLATNSITWNQVLYPFAGYILLLASMFLLWLILPNEEKENK